MIFTNAQIFQGREGFLEGSLAVREGRIERIWLGEPFSHSEIETEFLEEEVVDLKGDYLIPGLIDMHTHGNSGHDFSDGSLEGLKVMGAYLPCHGITSFAPTSMTLPMERLRQAFQTAVEYDQGREKGEARLLGVHMEGPYFCEKRKGAQNGEYLRLPDSREFLELFEGCGRRIRIVDLAPELSGAKEFIREVKDQVKVSIAHTDADYEQARDAFEAGASHLTHLFNAMPSLHHRKPGVIGAASEREDVVAELICDGKHVHPSMIRLAFRLFPGRICLISDSIRCLGLPEGDYELGDQLVSLKDGAARLPDGTLAGAATNLYEDMVNCIRFGIPAKEAILAATLIPAKELGFEKSLGSLEAGKRADLCVCDREFTLKKVYLEGERVR